MDIDEVRARITQLAADALLIPVKDLPLDVARHNDGRWDSIAHLVLVLAIEDEFDVLLSLNEIEEARSIGDIAAFVLSRAS